MNTISRDRDGESLTGLISRTVDETRGVVSAEIEVYKARLAERVSAYTSAAIFFAVAAVLALAALNALLVGLILSLSPLVGPGFATLIVVGVVLLTAGVAGWVGSRRLAPANLSAEP